MGIDVLLVIISAGFMTICGGFASYGCYRCFTDRTPSSVHSENSFVRKELYKNYKRHKICSCFRQSKKHKSSSSSLSSFAGTIYTVNSGFSSGTSRWSREMDGKVPLDLLTNYKSPYSNQIINQQIMNWTREKIEEKTKERASTAPV